MTEDERRSGAIASVRRLLDEHERGERTLPSLLGDLKQLLTALPDDDALRGELTAGLRAVGRAWSGGREGAGATGTLSLNDEHRLHDALAELRSALERRGAKPR